MHPAPRHYLFSPETDPSEIVTTIGSTLHCATDATVESICRYLDSFEWNLYLAGAALEERMSGTLANTGRELRWLDLGNHGAVVARQMIAVDPDFVESLPEGPVRGLLAPVLGIRRLLPMAELRICTHGLRVLNDDDKTVVRILIEESRPIDAAGHRLQALPARLFIQPVRGYERKLEATIQRLQSSLGLHSGMLCEPATLFQQALASVGRRPGSYSSKLAYQLDPQQPADAAAKQILRGLFDTLEANIDGTLHNLDSEFLHDLRVATRRTRSALAQIKGVFPPAVVDEFKAGFAWLQQVTGPMRDLDVYLLDFPNLRESLPESMRDDLEPLRDWLRGHYAEQQTKLVEALESPQFRALREDWRAFLEMPNSPSLAPAPRNARRSIKSVADSGIRSMLKRVRREGRAITDASPAEELHELRKSCKKLRYLMEFFESLYPADEIRGLIKQCKILLDNLGSFQDLQVQADHLRDSARHMQAEGAADTATLLSIGALVKTMLDQQVQARKAFTDTFTTFDSAANRAAFKRLFAAAAGTDAKPTPSTDCNPAGNPDSNLGDANQA
ncbi:MAG: CHAD domain-containing protein [Thiohalocapsa sp. PB-PSB1]|jgi:CHAD domain-containing protein|nr:MAG: CHAD domain-containing protein [Thiohalocapsa sp. PB-PSB1]HCS90503.1 hypothetical protein [Chromatiaceae bacterium]